jgi:hypothetical protein
MSVAISVGFLDEMRRCDEEGFATYRKVFKEIKAMLEKANLPVYDEPEDLQGKGWWSQVLPSNGIAYLQRLAAYLWKSEEMPDPGTQEIDNPLQEGEMEFLSEDCYCSPDVPNLKEQRFDHLVCHSPRDGYWLPLDFDLVIIEPEGHFASSVRLKKACEDIAAELELPLDLDLKAKEMREAALNPGKGRTGWKKYGIESYNCLLMYQAATRSVELGAAIVIH